uniref:Uncharacterized protein n=1 Tax=Romanomermis culicivorax TaxID=13658 RepID=A0A915L2M0_ROMCU
KKRRDSRDDTRSREHRETDTRTRERPLPSTARKQSDDYDSRKYRHGEYASNERPRKFHCDHNYRIEWASALKRDQLKKEELEGQQPPMAGSEPMIDEPSTSQQAEIASEQQKPQRTVREYKIPYRRHGRPRTPPEERYPSVPTAPITAQIQLRTTDE